MSNESPQDVFFDDVTIQYKKGPLLDETHYTPFGLTMAGISSKAAGKLENKYKLNDGSELANKEFSDGSGLELYETDFRSYDPQIGRFHQIDPLADYAEYNSPYTFASNNPISFNDPTGLIDSTHKEVSTPNKPTDLQPVIIYSPVKIKQKVDNANVVIKIPSLTLPKPIGPGGNQWWADGNGEGSTASPSDGGDKQPEEFGLLLDNISMSYKLESPHPELFNPLYYYEKAHELHELHEQQKKAEEEKKYENAKPKSVIKRIIPMGAGRWDYYYRKKSTGQYKSGEADSIVRGNGDSPDTNFIRTYSQPPIPKNDIPRKN